MKSRNATNSNAGAGTAHGTGATEWNDAENLPGVGAPESRRWSRDEMIATAAFYRAERRGFAPGHEVEDWLLAEADICNLTKGMAM